MHYTLLWSLDNIFVLLLYGLRYLSAPCYNKILFPFYCLRNVSLYAWTLCAYTEDKGNSKREVDMVSISNNDYAHGNKPESSAKWRYNTYIWFIFSLIVIVGLNDKSEGWLHCKGTEPRMLSITVRRSNEFWSYVLTSFLQLLLFTIVGLYRGECLALNSAFRWLWKNQNEVIAMFAQTPELFGSAPRLL